MNYKVYFIIIVIAALQARLLCILNYCFVSGCSCFPQRYVLAVFILVGLVTCYLMRVCVNLALNEMTFKLNMTESRGNISTKHQYCPVEEHHINRTQSRVSSHTHYCMSTLLLIFSETSGSTNRPTSTSLPSLPIGLS